MSLGSQKPKIGWFLTLDHIRTPLKHQTWTIFGFCNWLFCNFESIHRHKPIQIRLQPNTADTRWGPVRMWIRESNAGRAKDIWRKVCTGNIPWGSYCDRISARGTWAGLGRVRTPGRWMEVARWDILCRLYRVELSRAKRRWSLCHHEERQWGFQRPELQLLEDEQYMSANS